MRRRHLNPEERLLWEAVAKSAKPIAGRRPFVATAPADPPSNAPKAPPTKPRIDPFLLGERAPRQAPRLDAPKTLSASLSEQPLAMDAKTHTRMTKGKLSPEARLDLHGMTLSEAHSELIAFILTARAQGLRLVLVITGKGKAAHDSGAIPQRIGALRHQLPHWLRLPPLAPAVQQLTEAHLRHGGSGAYYVYLRRK
jgi:DNA-nicking Smr family endonuclease